MRNFIVLLAFILCASCVKDSIESVSIEPAASKKIVMLSRNNVAGSMIVCFTDEVISRVEAGLSRSGATRSGLEQFDSVLDRIGAERMERVFLANRFEERLREEGMHRWYVVHFDEDTDLSALASDFAALSEVETVQYNAALQHITDVAPQSVHAQIAQSAEPMVATRADAKFNDPDLVRQWHYINTGDKNVFSGVKAGADVNLGEAWDITAGDNRVIVAVIDAVVKADHPDLIDNMWVNTAEKNGQTGKDDDGNGFVDDIYGINAVTVKGDGTNCALALDDNDHGTHVAGTVAAVNNNGKGGCGVAGGTGKGDGVRIMSCQIFYGKDGATDLCAARAFHYAADNGASIAQCSYGYQYEPTADREFSEGNSVQKKAIDYFIKYGGCDALKGGLPIFAAGNESYATGTFPGAYRDYLCVSAMSCDYTPAFYTNFGPGVNIAAPGGDYLQKYWTDYTGERNSSVYSTTFVSGNYGYKQGTSMACPHVSGVAALAISHALSLGKSFSAIELKHLLLASTHDIDRYCTGTKDGLSAGNNPSVITINLSKYKGKMGVGYIDAYKALMNVQGTPCLTLRLGVKQSLNLENILGGNPETLTFVNGGVSMSQADRTKLGVEGDITISSTGKMQIKCNKPGSAIIKINYIAGGAEAGSEDKVGGMVVEREVALLVRGFATNGGWL